MNKVNGSTVHRPVRATQEEIEQALMNASVAIEDAKLERDHWKNSFQQVQYEMLMLCCILFPKLGVRRLIVTEQEVSRIDKKLNLWVGNPEPGVRHYELREGEQQKVVPPATGGLIVPAKP